MLPIYDRDERIPDTLYDSLVRRVIDHALTLSCSAFSPENSLDDVDTIEFYKSLGALRELLFAIQRICCVQVCYDVAYCDNNPYRLYNLMIDGDVLVYHGKLAPFFKYFISASDYDIADFCFYDTSEPDTDDDSLCVIEHEFLSPDDSI